uniref:HAT C-terminal dimerisation domain-containing protein n=1 Tax=Knipowitschia caucasica TaxID=637954 RepID=A0AAV2KUY3_KNICA
MAKVVLREKQDVLTPAAVHDHAEEVSTRLVTQGEGNQEGLKTDSEEEEENQPPPSKQSKKSPLEELFAEEDAMKRTSQEGVMSMESRAEREIQTYLEIPSIITSSDPAAWFWTQKQTYPLLKHNLCGTVALTAREGRHDNLP